MGDSTLVQDVHKGHRPRQAGAKAKKKEAHQKKKKGLSTERHNPRAFSVANIKRTQRNTQRNLDRAQQKEHVPLVDRTEALPPPSLVVVMGPKGCGKSTLIRSLVKYYTRQNLSDVLGPITVVAGKAKRLTFFECPGDDLCAMLDLAKTADLVLLMVDGSFGFEMETFEFLNMLQTHGFPKVMGVMSHLDGLKNNKALGKTKKRLKQRFWTEIYQGAKMFYLSGVINHKYLKGEIRNITLYISRMVGGK
ncbi:ribosome biogenesis protein bms1-like protein, partial [Nannochloropsis gaditana]